MSISKSLLCIRRCISFFFCICNVCKYYFLFVWEAKKVEAGEYDVFMNDFHLCTLESAWSGLVSMSAGPGPLKTKPKQIHYENKIHVFSNLRLVIVHLQVKYLSWMIGKLLTSLNLLFVN